MDFIIVISAALMFAFVISKNSIIGGFSWILFGFGWITKLPYYLDIGDYFNSVIIVSAFILFTLIGIAIIAERDVSRLNTFLNLSAFSALSAIFYFPFAMNGFLGDFLISKTAQLTVMLANFLGYNIQMYGDRILYLNGKCVEIILACTGIESIALFAGATLGMRADWSRKLKAFMVSVPVIYVLNLLRNVFITVSFGYSWFGENSFYIAHHIISKILATLALILISLTVFRILPELADLIYDLKDILEEKYLRFMKKSD
ncbi:archaeosortase A, PGF-CTERM-specific [Archaeoglobus sulfaticallidus PM70-1]|uniref:Archaeosortase A, PGF-CTERM-specific n=1 Tax=Archaeoglobus sulfaticallidus PM70-1 TaxID=387631 RepID=N0BDC7_9EURY|nr:archaeosortase A [Archaeoglobus sulfaticallidus]AGK60257.1 archaeosortase A, PGF-CTERM-specific [Archaeoglobus sulfaticallidus PM70-1]